MATGDDLPLPVIQQIQSYLNWKDAARSSFLSKAWYTSWSTRPKLELNDLHFSHLYEPGTSGFSRDFQDYARKTLKRYQDQNLKLESLRFRMLMAPGDHESPKLANELISHALKLGLNDLDLKVFFAPYNLPNEVFDSVSLRTLSLDGCIIHWGVICSPIVSLELCRVPVTEYMMGRILVGCPSIEKLSLVSCKDLREVDLSLVHRNLKHFTAREFTDCYAGLLVRFEEHRYPNLISLQLDDSVKFDLDTFRISYFQDRFPCMEKLTKPHLASNKKKTVDPFRHHAGFSVKQLIFHVPDTAHNRLGSLTSAERKYIELSMSPTLDASWFLELRNFLQEYSSSSGTSLVIVIDTWGLFSIDPVEDIQCVTATLPVVENLTIETAYNLNLERLSGLFWSCRPKFVTLTVGRFSTKNSSVLFYDELKKVENRLVLLYDELKKLEKRCVKSIHDFYCVHGLEEVDMEVFDESLKVWRPAPREGLEKCSIATEQVRLRLTWLSV